MGFSWNEAAGRHGNVVALFRPTGRGVSARRVPRDALVRTRTRFSTVIKAAVRCEGLRLPLGDPERTAQKLAAVAVRSSVRDELAPLLAALEPLNAVAFIATLDDVTRFRSAHQVEAYLGLVPSESAGGHSLRALARRHDVSHRARRRGGPRLITFRDRSTVCRRVTNRER